MRESGDYRSPLRPAKDAGSYPATNEHSSASSETAAVRRESWSREGQVLESDGHAICILCVGAVGRRCVWSGAANKSQAQRQGPSSQDGYGSAQGFAVAPMVLTDEGCARDYVRAFQAEGVELRRRLADLETYHCIDTTATGIFIAVSIERKDFAVEKGKIAYFRNVVMTFDPERTKSVVPQGRLVNPPDKTVYSGWIPDEYFYPVSSERFNQLLAEKKIPITIR